MALSRLSAASATKANVAKGQDFIKAINGEIIFYTDPSTNYKYQIHRFWLSGTFTIESGKGTVEYLVAAGGGTQTGGQWNGGGGAGGVRTGTFEAYPGNYSVTVGEGNREYGNGTNSSFSGNGVSVSCTGGGSGGSRYSASQSGGSGGGGGGYNTSPGSGVAGEGNRGGYGSGTTPAGGGGAGGVGNTGIGNTGGPGIFSSITGQSIEYGRGQGGRESRWVTHGTGSAGGGAAGDGRHHGPGGSGIVIFRYRIA